MGAASIAFPAISTGVYGYPPELAAALAVTTVGAADTDVSLVRFVAFDAATLGIYRAADRLSRTMRQPAASAELRGEVRS